MQKAGGLIQCRKAEGLLLPVPASCTAEAQRQTVVPDRSVHTKIPFLLVYLVCLLGTLC